jgi:hypothetical protein
MTAPCNCDESIALRAEVERLERIIQSVAEKTAVIRAEHAYMLTGLSPSEIRQMRAELSKMVEP